MDKRTAIATNVLKRSAEFTIFTQYLEEMLDNNMKALVAAQEGNFQRVQGKAQVLTELLKDIKDSTKITKTNES